MQDPSPRYLPEKCAALAVVLVFLGWAVCGFMVTYGEQLLPGWVFAGRASARLALLFGLYGAVGILYLLSVSEEEYQEERRLKAQSRKPKETVTADMRLQVRKDNLAGTIKKLRVGLEREKS